LSLHVIHTPGHSPGSISIHIPTDSALFTGDAVPLPGDLPIFTDWRLSLESLERIKSLSEVELLLSSWDAPAQGDKKDQLIAAGIGWLEKIKEVVADTAGDDLPADDPLALCRVVCRQLQLPPAAVNPLVAASFASC
jgi:glyoxylase-like metal-dependent hydrolase (beta-lactamase superfamily II)